MWHKNQHDDEKYCYKPMFRKTSLFNSTAPVLEIP